MKFWPRLFLAESPSERTTSRSGGKPSGRAAALSRLMAHRSRPPRPGGAELGGELQGGHQAAGRALPVPAMSKAVP